MLPLNYATLFLEMFCEISRFDERKNNMKKLILITMVFCASCGAYKPTHNSYHRNNQKFVSNEQLRKRHQKRLVVIESIALFGVIIFAGSQIETK